MLKPEHAYLVMNGLSKANAIIQETNASPPSRIIFEYAPNHPVTHNNGFKPEQVFIGPNKQITIFVKQQISPLRKIARWLHGTIYRCPICLSTFDAVGNDEE